MFPFNEAKEKSEKMKRNWEGWWEKWGWGGDGDGGGKSWIRRKRNFRP